MFFIMNKVYVSSDNIITSLGFSTEENISKISNYEIGIKLVEDKKLSPVNIFASLVDSTILDNNFNKIDSSEKFTRFEKLAILSIHDALKNTPIDFKSRNTLFILSTTKGNIDVLEENSLNKFGKDRLKLSNSANLISNYFGNINKPLVISNACISGVLAIITGSRLIRSGLYENIVITGVDIVSEFVVSGFLSFQSLSNVACKPFDINRNGLSLGEGCGTIILTSNKNNSNQQHEIIVGGGSSSNDANHISGPSRTGEGLLISMNKTIEDVESSEINQIDFISLHGTATSFNDEMESIAINRAGLKDVPVNSFKGYWGHTLGAAGIIESIASIYSIKNNIIFGTAGFDELGVTSEINVSSKHKKIEISNCLKTASGFGGCNAGIIFYKNERKFNN